MNDIIENATRSLRLRQTQLEDALRRRRTRGAGEETRAANQQEHHELIEVDHAIQKLHLGTYGACERCGGPIGRFRLRAIPEARLCATCAERIPR